MSSLLLLALLCPQDLIERDQALRRRLPPGLDMKDVKPTRVALQLDAGPDFGCGSFDLKASFRSLFTKNLKEEFLGGSLSAIQSELASSALVLACYASPTVCDAIKHYRTSANSMLGMELDGCRSLEQSLEGVQRQSQARAIKECLDEKSRQGVPLDDAQKACRKSTDLRGLDGRPVKQIDLNRDLGLPDTLVPPLKIGAGTLRAEARGTAVLEAYEAKRQEKVRAWEDALRNPATAAIDRLGSVSRAEVERMAAMEPGRRETAVRSVAAAQALAELVGEAQTAERTLESAELLATPEVRGELERRRAQLRNEIGRLSETFEAERRVNAAIGEAQAAAAAEVAEKARERLASRRVDELKRGAEERLKPWGCEVQRDERKAR
ncbi:MAG TPA: hypothetical protein VNM14_03955 [Planctomycetota bacterium]|nr:hypothetical protein [Planctomycetota bacterium]